MLNYKWPDMKNIANPFKLLISAVLILAFVSIISISRVLCANKANEIVKNIDTDLMLLDVKMPETDGTILYEITRAFHKGVKIIVSSVYPLDDQKNIIKGAVDYYDKSEGIKVLKEKVRHALFNP